MLTDEERKERKRIRNKKYYEENRDLIVEYRKRSRNPDLEKERFRKWYKTNQDAILERKREKYWNGK